MNSSIQREFRLRNGLPHTMARLKKGGRLRVAYLGGSITQSDGWRTQTDAWLRKTFPKARVEMTMAAVGGTDSSLGVFRLDQEVLAQRPDLVFVEFAVNDSGTRSAVILCAMEGIVRKIRRHSSACDICFVYTISAVMLKPLQKGRLPRSIRLHEKLAGHYGIPSVHMGLRAVALLNQGRLVFTAGGAGKKRLETAGKMVFARDNCHPLPLGHRLYAEAVQRAFKRLAKIGSAGRPCALPKPLRSDHWGEARMIPVEATQRSGAWTRLKPPAWPKIAWSTESLPALWKAEKAGTRLSLSFAGQCVGILHVVGPDTGQIECALDRRKPVMIRVFDSFCTYHRPGFFLAAHDLAKKPHRLRLTVTGARLNKAAILAKNGQTMDNPQRFAGNFWYPSAILLVGKPV